MSFLFSRSSKQKSPPELVRSLCDVLNRIETNGSDRRKSVDELSRLLLQMKMTLYGDQETDPIPDQIASLAQEVYSSDVLIPLIKNLHILEFDSRKDVIVIFTTLLRRQIGNRSPTVDYLTTRPTIFDTLITWSNSADLGITANAILRDCLKYDELARIIINSPLFWSYLDYVDSDHFETASDAFTTVHELFSSHSTIVADFLARNSNQFATKMNSLMCSSNYVTKRQSIKIMSQVLRERSNYQFMTEYISIPEHLKQVMILLRDKSKNVQYEAFQIFKVIVANPKKPKPIIDILTKNKYKLVQFLTNFHSEKKDDENFKEEKAFIIKQISSLPDPQPPSSSSSSHPASKNSTPTATPNLPSPNASSSTTTNTTLNNSPSTIPVPSVFSPTAPTMPPPPVVHADPVHRQDYFDKRFKSPSASPASSSPSASASNSNPNSNSTSNTNTTNASPNMNFHHPLPKLPSP